MSKQSKLELGTWVSGLNGGLYQIVRMTETSAWVQTPNGTTLGKTQRMTRRVSKQTGREYLSLGRNAYTTVR